jgi:hypothetical protein
VTYQSVQLGFDNKPVAGDIHDHVYPGTRPGNPNSIQTRVGPGRETFQSGGQAQRVTNASIQLQEPSSIGGTSPTSVLPDGTRTDPATEARLRVIAPHLFADEATKRAAQAAHEAEVKAQDAAEATRAEINTHPHPEVEEAHAAFASLPTQDAVSLLVAAQRGQAPTEAQLGRLADAWGVSKDAVPARIELLNVGVQGQFGALARSMGLDPDEAADHLRRTMPDTVMSVLQAHVMRRDLMAWKPLLAKFKTYKGSH